MVLYRPALALVFHAFVTATPSIHAREPYEAQEREPAVTAATLTQLSSRDAQTPDHKVWIYFTDKGIQDAQGYAAQLQTHAAGLDPHAAARRARSMGPALCDHTDLAICEDYRVQIVAMGLVSVQTSRWLNAVSVYGSIDALQAVAQLQFVRKITPVAQGRSDRARGSQSDTLPDPEPRRDAFDYGPSRDQFDEIGVLDLHELGLSGAGVRIAVLDTGFYRDHPAVARILAEGRLLAQWDFINNDGETQDEPGDPEGQHNHGTTVWSLIGGFAEGELIAPAYGADFLLAKTEDTSGEEPIEEDYWVAAAEWADAQGADVLSSSLAYIQWYEYSDLDGDTATTTIAADIAAGRGIVVCSAAGNYGTMDWFYIGAPADADSIVAVGATEPDGSMWLDSSHGPTYDGRTKPEVCARGAMTYAATIPGGHGGPDEYRHFDGTSVATPMVAGCAALLLETHPIWTAMEVREALMMTADNNQSPDNHRGWGRIDASEALVWGVSSAPSISIGSGPIMRVTPNPSAGGIHIQYGRRLLDSTAMDPGTLRIFSPEGALIRHIVLSPGDHSIGWDLYDTHGHRVAPGFYLARLQGVGIQGSARIIVTD